MEGLAYVNGTVQDLAEATVPLNDRGYLLGDGVFETLRTSNGHPFRLDDHAARLRDGLDALGLDASLEENFRTGVAALVEAGTSEFGEDLYVRINVTTGVMEDIAGTDLGASVTGVCKPFKPYPMQYYAKGVHVITSRFRKDPKDPLAAIKHMSFLPYIAARRQALAATVHDALLLNTDGDVAEATTSNVFAVQGDRVHAPGPDQGAMPGVTRQVLLELLEDTGIAVTEPLDLEALRGADEVWISNTTGGVVPVTRIDDQDVGDGRKGELTTRLGNAYEDLVRSGHDHDGE